MRPSEYEHWSEQDRGLAEALVIFDASVNMYGIPLDVATDYDVGFDVTFERDWTVQAVKDQEKVTFGKDGAPAGTIPRVSVNAKSLDRLRARRASTED